MDGSLLNDRGRVGEADADTIRALKAGGVYFFLATGRPFDFIRDTASRIGFDLPVCACNGGQIYDFRTGESLFENPLPREAADALYARFVREGTHFSIYTRDRVVFSSDRGKSYLLWKRRNEDFAPENRFVPRFATDPDFDIRRACVIKYLLYFDAPDAAADMAADIRRCFGETLTVARSGERFLDVNAAGADKGDGVRRLAALYGFDLGRTMAIGDNENDAAMLRAVGIPVAPANADARIREMAAYITASNNDSPLTKAVAALFPRLLGA